jgi:hypothetical protein
MIWLDFETRSRCDLKSRGVYNYAQDLSTDVLCMSYAFDDEDVATWLPGMPFPDIAAIKSWPTTPLSSGLSFGMCYAPRSVYPSRRLSGSPAPPRRPALTACPAVWRT